MVSKQLKLVPVSLGYALNAAIDGLGSVGLEA